MENKMTNKQLLDLYLTNQREHLSNVIAELLNYRKETHWCWYFLPNIPGLGNSEQSKRFAIDHKTLAELLNTSKEFRQNIFLTALLIHRICSANTSNPEVMQHTLNTVIMADHPVDALKFRSFITLMHCVHKYSSLETRRSWSPEIKELFLNGLFYYGECERTWNACSALEDPTVDWGK